jgi:hypothetical protein
MQIERQTEVQLAAQRCRKRGGDTGRDADRGNNAERVKDAARISNLYQNNYGLPQMDRLT